MPSFLLLYFIEGSPRDGYTFIVKAIGNQWFWVYEMCYENKNVIFMRNSFSSSKFIDSIFMDSFFCSEYALLRSIDVYNLYNFINFENSLWDYLN